MSFNMSSSVMNDKSMMMLRNSAVENTVQRLPCIQEKCCNHLQTVCYTPKNAVGMVSLTKNLNSVFKKTLTTDQELVIIPANAIIDSVEFFGLNGFATKGVFSIGLGQLNDAILMPLIENSDSSVANEKIGGCRNFISNTASGKNNKNLVLFDSNVNIVLENPITSGALQVIVSYHMKI